MEEEKETKREKKKERLCLSGLERQIAQQITVVVLE